MKTLTLTEVMHVSGATIHPSGWVWGAGYGMSLGAICSVASGFSKNAIGMSKALGIGAALGAGMTAVADVVHEVERY